MKKDSIWLVVLFSLIGGMAVFPVGCATVQDIINSVQDSTNAPPAITNVIPVVTNLPPVVAPPEPPESPVDIPVPPRLGVGAYKGTGIGGTFKEVPGSGGWNPKKSVMMQAWVKINGWPRPDEGCSVINKGLVGSSWAYSLTVRPDALQYGATNGRIEAAFKFKAGVWYHVRIDVTATTAKFWVDGRGIPVTKNDVKQILGANEEPLRIGGQRVPDTWNGAAWYNSALDGVMSDWKVVVE